MNVVKAQPPNFEEIVKVIPAAAGKYVVFTYGDTLYAPTSDNIPEHLMAHEETHSRQQAAMGVDNWWKKYLENVEFRLSQEVEAYHNQYQYVCNSKAYPRHSRKIFLLQISKDLASPLYGNSLNRNTASWYIKRGKYELKT